MPFKLKVTLHDNFHNYDDATAEINFVLVKDSTRPDISTDNVKNVSTVAMGMTANTTPEEVVTYLQAEDQSISGNHTLDDNFILQHLNASQFAALLFLEALEIKKNYLVNLVNKYQMQTSYLVPNWSNYQIDLRIDHVTYAGETGNNQIFNVSFEQDVRDASTNKYFPSNYYSEFYARFPEAGYDEKVGLVADIPSAYYLGNDVYLNEFVSTYSDNPYNDSKWPLISGGESISASLNPEVWDMIVGNFNCLYRTPFESEYAPKVPKTQTDFSPLDIAKLF
jgi:hypothetical protein